MADVKKEKKYIKVSANELAEMIKSIVKDVEKDKAGEKIAAPTVKDVNRYADKPEGLEVFWKAVINRDYEVLKHFKTVTTSNAAAIMLPEEYEDGIIKEANKYGVAQSVAMVGRIKSDTKQITVEGDDVAVYWPDEATALTTASESVPTSVTLNVKEMAAIAEFSRQSEAFAREDPKEYMVFKLGKAVAKEIDNQYFMGTGSPFTGLLQVDAATVNMNEVQMNTGNVNFIDVTYNNLVDVMSSISGQYKKNARWFISPDVWAILMKLKDNNNLPLFHNPISGGGDRLIGYKVVDVEVMSDLVSGADTAFLIFGDPRPGTRILIKQGMTIDYSEQAQGIAANYWTARMFGLRLTMSLAIGVADGRGLVRLRTAAA